MEDIVIFGSGGLAREVAFVIEEINRVTPQWQILGFVEPDESKVGTTVGRYKVFCTENELTDKKVAAVIGIGTPAVIQKIASKFDGSLNISFPNIIHPSVVWDQERISIGKGNVICAGNIFTTDISIGSFNYFNLSCTYGHDATIGNCNVFNPGVNLSGGVELGSRCLIGTGAKILQYLKIGDDVTVGAGSVVTKNVSVGTTVVGVPAKPLTRN